MLRFIENKSVKKDLKLNQISIMKEYKAYIQIFLHFQFLNMSLKKL